MLDMLVAMAITIPDSGIEARAEFVYVQCVSEDSPGNCYWDARNRGNGKGMSFVRHSDGTIEYVNPDIAFPK